MECYSPSCGTCLPFATPSYLARERTSQPLKDPRIQLRSSKYFFGFDSAVNCRSKSLNEEPDLIQVVNDLQDRLTATGQSLNISLPQIVVVGCQSAGKSSVLENIVGREFLPRGSGVVTRRPTIVQLHPSPEEYAIFLHKPSKKITDFSEVKQEIEEETLHDPGPTGFSNNPINVQIYSPNVLKLTLVDLPGLVKNPVGEQTDSVVTEVRDMIMNYISQPKCLILAVSPANQDIANSDSLNIAKLVDPERDRTIGVLTKLDLMDQGTHARDILENKVLPLKRGYVGVVNRSQRDIEESKDINYILSKEKRFFEEHPQYQHLASRMGTKHLQNVLHKQLRAHIQSTLPEVRNELDVKYTTYRKELDNLNEKLGEAGRNDKRMFMIKLVQQFVEALHTKLVGQSERIDLKSLSGGAYINYLMYTKIQDYLNLSLEPDRKELTIAITNISGFRTGISVPSLAFDAVGRILIEKFKLPLEKCVETIAKVLSEVVSECADEVKEYPTLQNELKYKVNNCIKQQEKITKDIIKSHVESEMYYINLGHPDFEYSILKQVAPQAGPVMVWNENSSSASGTNTKPKYTESVGEKSSQEMFLDKLMENGPTQQKVDYMSAMISKYVEIVRKTIGDMTIKYIMFYLVKSVLDFTKVDLLARLLDSGNEESLMQECEDDILRQEQLEVACAAISCALDAIHEF